MGIDLGTYYIRVEFSNARGFIFENKTGHRYTDGKGSLSPLSASVIKPVWDSEEELISSALYMWLEGNFSCDCNLKSFIAQAYQEDDCGFECGEDLKISSLTIIRPDLSEMVIYSA